jgi:Tol biopolymer transport system component/predicted Ser/Thr protein kinase
MSYSPGDRLGAYEILSLIGAGGMGEVYRARDTKLKREVALKVLPDAFASDPERMARFQREAEVLACLNHPNIAQIYGVEERALVMELVEGEALKGPLPVETALNYARQIADALEAAHEKGVTHRDLKPANIMITPAGVLKVLDFGLAAYSLAREGGDSTLTMSPTRAGMIMGTAPYMSPEQAIGKPVDRRADIWSFGVVLYEMLAGKRLFSGESAAEILASVIKEEPNLDALPASVRPIVERCLRKDLKYRWQAIGDVRIALEEVEQAILSPAITSPATRSPAPLGWIAAGVIALAAVLIYFRQTAPPPERALRYTIAAPENSAVHSFAISPDGRYVTIAAAVQGKRQLWLRPLDALQSQPIPGTEDAAFPFWSPDSRYIGFFAQGKLKKIASGGGPAQSLCNAESGRGGTWNRDDVIVFFPDPTSAAIQRVPAAGGVPADVTKTKGQYRFPVFLPDGRHFLYTVVAGSLPEKTGVYLSSLDGNENRRVLADRSSVAFAAGHLLFIRENTLMAQPFDARSAQTSGDAFPLAEGVAFSTTNPNFALVSVSESGVLLYASGGASGNNQIAWFDRAGKLLGSAAAPGNVSAPSISPDERLIAFSRNVGRTNADVWLRDLARGTDTRFTFDASRNLAPFWSPKGDRIVFASNRGGVYNLYEKAASGSGQDELLLSTPNLKAPDQWSRNGRFIVYSEIDPKTKFDLWVLPVGQGGGKPIPFLQTEFNELMGQISPDGHWMAYTSDESGQREVYVRPFPASDGKWRISTAGGDEPRWRGDGKELFFAGADGKMMAVAVKAAAEEKPFFEAGPPVPLFESHIAAGGAIVLFEYDVTEDGKRFLVATSAAAASTPPLTVVVNWTAGLKK